MVAAIYYADAIIGVFLLYIVKKALSNHARQSYPYPPGPRPWPLIGNIFNMPKVPDPWNAFTKLAKKYGPLLHFKLLNQHFLVINSHGAAIEMLERMVYSDRPPLVMATELSGYQDSLPLMPYNARFRAMRKLIHRFIGTRTLATKFGADIEREEVRRLMRRVLEDPRPEVLREHVRKMAGAVILRMTYRYEPRENDDPLVHLAEEAMEQFSVVCQAGAFLVDVAPWLRYIPRWMPGAGFLHFAEDAKRNIDALAQRPMDYTIKKMVKGDEEISFVSQNVTLPLSDEDESLFKWTAANMYAGGADTSVSTLYAAFLALVMYPDVQKKAQEEVDRVIGLDRLPTIDDRDALPFIDAMTKELFRWNPTAPLGAPHRLMEDDVFNGYFIPKGTIVVSNIQSMLNDEELYPEPRKFDPERHLPYEGKETQPNPYPIAFGFGRRTCPGIQLADMSAFTVFATCAAVLDLEKAVDPVTGTVVEPEHVIVGGTVVHPAEFKCKIKARSDKAAALVMDMPFKHKSDPV